MTPSLEMINYAAAAVALICLAAIPGAIAEKKGRAFFVWYFYGLALWPVAVIHAACLQPNARARLAEGRRQCRACCEWVDARASICPYCRTADPAPAPPAPGS